MFKFDSCIEKTALKFDLSKEEVLEIIMNTKEEEIFYGETQCQYVFTDKAKNGKQCENNAYYKSTLMSTLNNKNFYGCGVHCKKDNRIELKKKSIAAKKNEDEIKFRKEREEIREAAILNEQNNKKGTVMISKFFMMKKPEDVKGFLKVFPNYKHQNRKDGFGCDSLSPKFLGPIIHGMFSNKTGNIPIAFNLENFHQFSKIFEFELDFSADNTSGVIKKEAIEFRNKGFEDPEPHRHKFSKEELRLKNKGILTPLFSVFYDKDGNEKRYSYIECRFFYCHFYELYTRDNRDLQHLRELYEEGTNLQIIGYDGYNVENNKSKPEDLYKHYLDPSRPFGHELVLFCLLIFQDPLDYPWNIYYNKHPELYENVIDLMEY